jgi:hypothetical protein
VNNSAFEDHPAAAQYEADRKLLFRRDPEARVQGCRRLAEAGSIAARALLQRAVDDSSPEVRREAVWSIIRLADDLQGDNEADSTRIADLLKATSWSSDPVVVLGEAVVRGRHNGVSAAQVAYSRLSLLNNGGNEASLWLLERLVREEVQEYPELRRVLNLVARHRLAWVRRRALELLDLLEVHQRTPDVQHRSLAPLQGDLCASAVGVRDSSGRD